MKKIYCSFCDKESNLQGEYKRKNIKAWCFCTPNTPHMFFLGTKKEYLKEDKKYAGIFRGFK